MCYSCDDEQITKKVNDTIKTTLLLNSNLLKTLCYDNFSKSDVLSIQTFTLLLNLNRKSVEAVEIINVEKFIRVQLTIILVIDIGLANLPSLRKLSLPNCSFWLIDSIIEYLKTENASRLKILDFSFAEISDS